MAKRKTFVESEESVEALSQTEAQLEELRTLSAKTLVALALSQGIDREFLPQWLRRARLHRFQSEFEVEDVDRSHLADLNKSKTDEA